MTNTLADPAEEELAQHLEAGDTPSVDYDLDGLIQSMKAVQGPPLVAAPAAPQNARAARVVVPVTPLPVPSAAVAQAPVDSFLGRIALRLGRADKALQKVVTAVCAAMVSMMKIVLYMTLLFLAAAVAIAIGKLVWVTCFGPFPLIGIGMAVVLVSSLVVAVLACIVAKIW